ncbi:MAG: Crp/Fnr family transcriptional regulator [Endozoicomonadaceae bacterium]|nr:Crp/Fnr family transcriptional regulator [Endozoicomonadaceae bacterium]
MKYFRKLAEQYISVDNKEWSLACEGFNQVSVKKGTIVHLAGDVFSDIWFIKSGLARSYFTDINGRDFTWQLYFRGKSKHGLNHFMDDSVSFYENSGSMLNFEVLENAVFYVISLDELDKFISKDKKWEHLTRVWLHDTYYAATYKRVISLMSETVGERYERLLEEYPQIFKQIKSYHIASYLGVAPQTLSKIKNESR